MLVISVIQNVIDMRSMVTNNTLVESTIQEIFKVPIYSVELDLDNKKLQAYCENYKKNINVVGRTRSNVGGYQSKDLSLDSKTLQPLIKEIETHTNIFANTFLNSKQSILNIWFNINQYKDSNQMHMHPKASISGVYYIKTPEECGVIEFEHPGDYILDSYNYDHNYKEEDDYNPYSATRWWLPSTENILYLFPAWLKHHVKINLNKNEERISMSFNTNHAT